MSKNQISRRTFIKGLAAGAASVATLGVLQGVEYSVKSKAEEKAAAEAAEAIASVGPAGSFTPGT